MEPIPSVNIVIIEKPNIGTSSNVQGDFNIKNVDVGTYSLKISAVGYTQKIITNIVVTTGRTTPATISLDESAVEVEGVTTSVSYFSKAQEMSPVSANVIERSEVLRLPGGIQDVQRVAQNLPGVASSTDNINELIVRGGAPYENLTIMDHMEIPSINHYSNQFNSAGPINMVNADMIEDVQFSTGGFPAQFGDRISSVMNLTVREGNRSKVFASKTAMNMAGIGTLIEGGFAGEHGSYIISARNSLLELIDKTFGLSKLSLTAIPKYWDTQSKITYDFSSSQKLSFNLLYGDSRIHINGKPNDKDELRKNMHDTSSVHNLYPVTKQYAVGLNLRTLYGKKGYSVFTFYGSGTNTNLDIREDYASHIRGPNGEVLSYQLLNSRIFFKNYSSESFIGGKYELFYQIHPQHDLSVGAEILTSHKWTNDVFLEADTSRYDLNRDGIFETGPISTPQYRYINSIGFGKENKYFIYANDKFKIFPDLAFSYGLRYDYFSYSGKGSLSPRASISYQIIQPTTTLTFATGQYFQTQPFPFYGDYRQTGVNRYIDNMKSVHYVLGLEHILGNGLKLNVESYYKKYKQIAVSEDFIYSAIDTFWSDRMLTIGDRYAYGLEFLLEQKQVSDYYGLLSLSLSKTKMKDPRIPPNTNWYNSEYDYPVIITALAGKVVKGVRDWLDNSTPFLKYPSYILPLSNEMEISFKYRFQTGRTFTPQEFVTWKQNREGGVNWSAGSWIPSTQENANRYPDYSRLDLQWISRFYMDGWNINAFVAVMNVMNTKNIFFKNYRSDGTVETIYQFAFFPVFGLEAEF